MLRTGDQIGPYTLINRLGRGAFGVVWLAERRTSITTTKAALKIPLDDEIDLETIKQEANLWVQASGHPNVLPIIEANVYDDQVIIASEFAPDGSLESWLKQHGGKAPTIESAVDIVSGILAGLEHLHARNIIHRDLKPANIIFQGETPRLADFGVSRVLKSTSQSSTAAGTPTYMAPEAFDGKRSEQTDVWSVGVIFYQLLAGRLPFTQADMASLFKAILSHTPDPLPLTVPQPIQEVVTRSLNKDPTQRYKSASEMRSDLRKAVEAARRNEYVSDQVPTISDYPVRKMPPETLELQQTRQNSRPKFFYAVIGLVAALVIALLSVVVMSFMSGKKEQSKDNAAQTTKPISTSSNVEPREQTLSTPITTATVAGKWQGQWNSSQGNIYSAEVNLDKAGSANSIQGSITWTLISSALQSRQSKIGLTATEFVKGNYNPMTRILSMEGYRKDDPNNIIALDIYRLVLSGDGKSLGGATGNPGQRSAGLSLNRK
jgi:serine/threonine protein kinase